MTASWNTCPIKQEIIKLLSYETRCNLRLCSKDDRDAVDSTRFVAKELQIIEIPSQMSDEKSIIRVSIDSFVIWFIGRNDVTKVDRAWHDEQVIEGMSELKNENRFDVARRFLERIMRNGTIEARRIHMELRHLEPLEHWTLKSKHLSLIVQSDESTLARQWLTKVECPLEKISAIGDGILEIADLPNIWGASRRIELSPCDLTDEQLDQMQATDVRIHSDSFTLEAVHRAIDRHLKYGRADDTFFLVSELMANTDESQILPPHLIFRRDSEGEPSHAKRFKITGGFKNVHGEQWTREGVFVINGLLEISKRPDKSKNTFSCPLYPFTAGRSGFE